MNLSPEEFADAACSALFTQLPAALAAETARHAAFDQANNLSVPLVAPAAEDYYPGGVQAVTNYPTIEVAVPDMQVADLSIGAHDGDVTLTLIVRAFDRDADFQTLYRKMNRLGSAITSVLVRPGSISDGVVTGIRGAWRFNPETEEQDHVVSGVLLAFTVETVLTRS